MQGLDVSQPYYDCRSEKWGLRIGGKQSILAACQRSNAFFLRYAEIAEQNKEPRWAAKVLIARRPEK